MCRLHEEEEPVWMEIETILAIALSPLSCLLLRQMIYTTVGIFKLILYMISIIK